MRLSLADYKKLLEGKLQAHQSRIPTMQGYLARNAANRQQLEQRLVLVAANRQRYEQRLAWHQSRVEALTQLLQTPAPPASLPVVATEPLPPPMPVDAPATPLSGLPEGAVSLGALWTEEE